MMVKICGITNREDALAAAECGAAAIGFIFASGSPRSISAGQAAEISAVLPSEIWKVGVFVDTPPARIVRIAQQTGIDVVQLHGRETPDEYPSNMRIWKAHRVEGRVELPAGPAEAWLLDGPASGRPFDWGLAAGLPGKIILAGGLDATNVRTAIERARPWGVDACSRLESSPGRKDRRKLAEFLKAARE